MASLNEEEQGKKAEGEQPPLAVSNKQNEDTPSPSQPSMSQSQGSASGNNGPPYQDVRIPWMFDSSGMTWCPGLAPFAGGLPDQAGSSVPMVPVLCPLPFPGYFQAHSEENQLRNGGIFAVPMIPMIGPVGGYPSSGLIPLSYNLPQNMVVAGNTTASAAAQPYDRAIPAQGQDVGAIGPVEGAGPQLPPLVAAQAGQVERPEGQRQIVRRFHVAFQIDLLLILKLAVVVFIFNQDGSRDRLVLLLFLAGLVYLYQTGALTPLLRRLSQGAQRAMMPPQRPARAQAPPADRAPVQGENAAAAVAADNNAAPVVGQGQEGWVAGDVANQAQQQQQQQQAAPVGGAPWWNFLKEVQMLVVGFVTSLLPGFHQHMD